MLSLTKALLDLLEPSEKKKAFLLIALMVLSAFADVLGVVSVLPFIAVAANPGVIDQNKYLFMGYELLGFVGRDQYLIFLGSLLVSAIFLSLGLKALTSFFQIRFVLLQEYSICRRLIVGSLNQPFPWFAGRDTSDIGKTILSEVNQVVGSGHAAFFTLLSQSILTLGLLVPVVLIDPKLAVSAFILILLIFSIFFVSMKKIVQRAGDRRLLSNSGRFKTVNRAFRAIKEIKYRGLEEETVADYSGYAKDFANSQASAQVIGQLPRYLIEAFAFGGIVLAVIYLIETKGDFSSATPVLSLYAMVGYKLLPSVQQIYGSIIAIKFISPAVAKLSLSLAKSNQQLEKNRSKIKKIKVKKSIELQNASFKYENSKSPVFDKISISIKAKSTVGFIGPSGSGKSTLINILLGLLPLDSGALVVDGTVTVGRHLDSWQNSIGYVPQDVYIFRGTVAENIAFEFAKNKIDMDLVRMVSKLAHIDEFIETLPHAYLACIGEDGSTLSGGQKQRLGIARALYRQPNILILDEATSALDEDTEQKVVESIARFKGDMVVLMIAHRLTSLKKCNEVFWIERGHAQKVGSLENLLHKVGSVNSAQHQN